VIKKINCCRSCKSKSLKDIFSLGKQYLTGVFPKNKNEKISSGYLSLVQCNKCFLLQLKYNFDHDEMYGENYGYMSSLNSSMLHHLKNKSRNLINRFSLKKGDLIVDIGSNDGTFLSFFSNTFKLIGVDPTIKKFSNFYKKNIIKIPDFFSEKIINKNINNKANLITSIAMFYDLEDPESFVKNVNNLLSQDGIWHVELSYMPAMLKNLSYDTICHEHLEYYSLFSIKNLLDRYNLKIINIEFNHINGGSFALDIAKKNSKHLETKRIINWILEKEYIEKSNSSKTFKTFFQRCEEHKYLLKKLILKLKADKKKIIAYGASTKGNVILQYCNINNDIIPLIAEVNKFKFNKYTPGTNLKIISEKNARQLKPDFFLVLPWHFRDFIINKELNFLKSGGKLIFPLPEIEII